MVSLIQNLSIDIVPISESWLRVEYNFSIPYFSSFRTDRFLGGSEIFIRSSIQHTGFSKIELEYAESIDFNG